MASGAAVLARRRRLGTKHIKHAPSARSVALPLEQLNSGCMKTVTFSRRRVDDQGIQFNSTRSFYLVIRCRHAGRWVQRQRGGGAQAGPRGFHWVRRNWAGGLSSANERRFVPHLH